MGFDFQKEATEKTAYELLKQIYSTGPLSEDLPETIEAIDQAVGEAYLRGEIKLEAFSESFISDLQEVLRRKNLLPEWDIKDLALKVYERFILGKHSWDFGLGKIRAQRLAIYAKLKDRPSVMRIIEITGTDHIPYEAQLTIERIQWIDSLRAEGKSYAEINSELPIDDPCGLLAFLNHVEETHKTTVTSLKDFQTLIGAKNEDDSIALYAAFELRYRLTLDRILREGGKYAQLLAIEPKDFHLPKTWRDLDGPRSKQLTIREAISNYFSLNSSAENEPRPNFREVARILEAPYSEILRAFYAHEESLSKGDQHG